MEKSTLRKVTAVPFASILMTLACQCFLFEEQFNKQSLAFHVEGKICNDIHLPGSSSLACDWIRATTVNIVQVWVAPKASWVSPCMDRSGWGVEVGVGADSELCLHASDLQNYLRKSNVSLHLFPGPLKDKSGNRGRLRARLLLIGCLLLWGRRGWGGKAGNFKTSPRDLDIDSTSGSLQSTHVWNASVWVLCKASPSKSQAVPIYY